jgi:hypothetical protein
MTESDEALRRHFSTVLADSCSTGAVGEFLLLLSQGILDGAPFANIIKEHGLNREPWFRHQRLDLIVEYVNALLSNGDLDPKALESIATLKKCLGVSEGDFMSLRPAEVAAVLTSELEVASATYDRQGRSTSFEAHLAQHMRAYSNTKLRAMIADATLAEGPRLVAAAELRSRPPVK